MTSNIIAFPKSDKSPTSKYYTRLTKLEDGSLWASQFDKLSQKWGEWYKLQGNIYE